MKVVKAKTIYTMDPEKPYGKYLLFNEATGNIEKVLDALSNSELSNVEVIDYGDYLITPGIIDSHNHLLMTGLHYTFMVNLSDAHNIDDIIQKLREFSGKAEFPWILGYGLYEGRIGRLPTRWDLDKAASDKPVFIMHTSGHYAVCNSKALEIAGITKSTQDPPGGLIGREPDGTPNGILYEPAAMDLVRRLIPPFTVNHYKEAILKIQDEYLKTGITTVKDPGGTGGDIDEELRIRALNELSENNMLKVRVKICLPVFSYEDAKRKVAIARMIREGEKLTFLGFKIFMDGSGLARTAWMRDPWNKNFTEIDDDNRGIPTWNLEELRKTIDYLLSEFPNKMICIHTIGDKAVEEALNIIENMKVKYPNASFTLIHVYAPTSRDIERIRENGVMIETQTGFMHFLGKLIISNLGLIRTNRFMNIRNYLEQGIIVCNSSDSDVINHNPIYGLITSIYRTYYVNSIVNTLMNTHEMNPALCDISLYDAFKLYTLNAQRCVHDNSIVALKPGNKADFVVWDLNLLMRCFEDPINCLSNDNIIKNLVIATYINGKIMHKRVA